MKRLLYLHGFASSGASGTVELLRRAFFTPDASSRTEVIAPDIPVDPAEALPMIKDLVAAELPNLIVGTSLGGTYAQQLRGFERICINPAFHISRLYSLLHVGKYKWLNRRRDGATEFHVDKQMIARFAEMEEHQFDGLCEEDVLFCHGLFGDADDIQPENREEFERLYPGQAHIFAGGHRMNADIVNRTLIPFIRSLGVLD